MSLAPINIRISVGVKPADCTHQVIRVVDGDALCVNCETRWSKPASELTRDELTLFLLQRRRIGSAQEQEDAMLKQFRVVKRA